MRSGNKCSAPEQPMPLHSYRNCPNCQIVEILFGHLAICNLQCGKFVCDI